MTAAAPPLVGSPAPDFTLPSTGGEDVTLSAYRGRSNVLLAFFPLAFTGVCTAEMREFSEEFSTFASAHTTVFGISVDSVPTLKEFKSKNDIAIDLLSDFKREVCRAYGTLLEEQFFSKRAYFIVDRQGVLRWTFTEAQLGDRRDAGELLERLETLYVRDGKLIGRGR